MRKLMLVPLALLVAGCVSSHPLHSSDPVKIVTYPAGAIATSPHGVSCVTPCKLRLLNSRGGYITIEKEGYLSTQEFIGTHVSDTKVALETASTTLTFVEPEPIDLAFEGLYWLVDPKGRVRNLDKRKVEFELDPIPPELLDKNLGDPFIFTGERIPLEDYRPMILKNARSQDGAIAVSSAVGAAQ